MNTQAVLLKCRPGARFHFGQMALDVNTALNDTGRHLPSDTLFSALVNTVEAIHPAQTTAVVEAFQNGDALLSSGFFCLEEGEKRIFFLPKPTHYDQYPPSGDPKAFRGVRYVSTGVWESGALPKRWHEDAFILLQNEFLVTREELSPGMLTARRSLRLYDTDLMPRVNARVPGADDSHFYSANIVVADNRDIEDNNGARPVPELYAHFYFLLRYTDLFEQKKETFQTLQTAIDLLPDMGVGGERTTGCGYFEGLERVDFPSLRAGKRAGSYASVSLSCPADAEDLAHFRAYETMLRGGRETMSDGRLQLVRMIAEGALQLEQEAKGSIADISPKRDGRYLRYGKTFNLPVAF